MSIFQETSTRSSLPVGDQDFARQTRRAHMAQNHGSASIGTDPVFSSTSSGAVCTQERLGAPRWIQMAAACGGRPRVWTACTIVT
jgi:hypothetical protein